MIDAAFGPPPPGDGAESAAMSVDDAFREVAAGNAQPWLRTMAHHAPEAVRGYAQLRTGAWTQDRLPLDQVHLILTALNAAENHSAFAAYHARLAREAGAGDAQLVEALVCVIPVAGITGWAGSAPLIFGGSPPGGQLVRAHRRRVRPCRAPSAIRETLPRPSQSKRRSYMMWP